MLNSDESKSGTLIRREYLTPFILVTTLFLFWGIPGNMNDILIKQFMKSFELNRFQAGLIQSAYYMGYFILAIPAGLLMRRFGYKVGLVTGLILFSLGALLFWPAAIIGKYGMFLFALFVIASGASFLETGANPFITKDPMPSVMVPLTTFFVLLFKTVIVAYSMGCLLTASITLPVTLPAASSKA